MDQITFLFLIVFISFFVLELLTNLWLDALNKKQLLKNKTLPSFFKGKIDEETYQKSREYSLAKLRFNKWEVLFSGVFTLFILFSGILPALDSLILSAGIGPILRGVLFLGGLSLLMAVIKYPLGIYNTFVIEGRFGFNNMTFKLFLLDSLKTALLSILIGTPFLAAILWFLNSSGSLWWVWATGFMFSFQILMLLIYPTFIAPLFNKFKPLEDGELKNAVMSLADTSNFSTSGVFVMDGSKRSAHSNAYFTGFGKLRRIVLFDTLIKQLELEELKSVLCHEMGHYKRGHIYKMILFSFALQTLGLYILSLAIDWPPLYMAFGFDEDPTTLRHIGLFLFMVTFSTFTFLLSPIMNFRSRKHEFEADEYAVKHTPSPKTMETALLKLAEKNLSNLTPHPWYSAFHYSHPTVYERVLAIQTKQGSK